MIIVGQNKTAMVNFNNIETLYLIKNVDKFKNIESVKINARGSYDYTLGEYATEERAKEVLKEIISISSLNSIQNKSYHEAELMLKFIKAVRYEMPKE